jgi:hypothetical protein
MVRSPGVAPTFLDTHHHYIVSAKRFLPLTIFPVPAAFSPTDFCLAERKSVWLDLTLGLRLV